MCVVVCVFFFFFQAEDGIRDLVRSRGLGDVYKRQDIHSFWRVEDQDLIYSIVTEAPFAGQAAVPTNGKNHVGEEIDLVISYNPVCLLYTSDAADERSSVDLGGRRIIKKKIKMKKAEFEAIA